MTDRLKILDCNRKAVLGLKSAALHLWMCYYMNEDEAQESWVSIPEIKAQTGLGRTSIIEWTDYLVRTGWLIDTGKTAADNWLTTGKQPTPGSYQVHVYRCDDPTKGTRLESGLVKCSSVTDKEGVPVRNLNQSGFCTSPESGHKVLLGLGSGSGSPLLQLGVGVHSGLDSDAPSNMDKSETNPQPENHETSKPENPKTQTKTKGVRRTKNGREYPEGFDTWTNAQRLAWLNPKASESVDEVGLTNDNSDLGEDGPQYVVPQCEDEVGPSVASKAKPKPLTCTQAWTKRKPCPKEAVHWIGDHAFCKAHSPVCMYENEDEWCQELATHQVGRAWLCDQHLPKAEEASA